MTKKTIITPSQLNNEQARNLLISMDREAIEFWANTKALDLVDALQDNLRSFGNYTQGNIIYKPDKPHLRK